MLTSEMKYLLKGARESVSRILLAARTHFKIRDSTTLEDYNARTMKQIRNHISQHQV